MEELVAHWRRVQALAGERREQAAAAAAVWDGACSVRRALQAAVDVLDKLRQPARYHYPRQLEDALAELQVRTGQGI